MKKYIFFFISISFCIVAKSQSIESNNTKLVDAYKLALSTVKTNTHDGYLFAGADYGGEWTRDISINIWNGVSFFDPQTAEKSLWSVTEEGKKYIGHQYWDKIIWIKGAYTHYLISQDKSFLAQAYTCGLNTMKQLEDEVFDSKYGLFMGPSVFNDGIAGYDAPIYLAENDTNSHVYGHATKEIKCLSTNAIYYIGYVHLNDMHRILYGKENPMLLEKAAKLKMSMRNTFYEPENDRLIYLVDQNGKRHIYQEALGIAYAILGEVVTKEEGYRITQKTEKSPFGIASIVPHFPRFSADKPGRHNRLVWPFINSSYACAALKVGNKVDFDKEFYSMASLALDADKGNKNFYEIFNPDTGKADGGWQSGWHWDSCRHQTWSATGYLSMVLYAVVGLNLEADGIYFKPYLPEGINYLKISDLKYGEMNLSVVIKGSGDVIKEFKINGQKTNNYTLSSNLVGAQTVEITLSK